MSIEDFRFVKSNPQLLIISENEKEEKWVCLESILDNPKMVTLLKKFINEQVENDTDDIDKLIAWIKKNGAKMSQIYRRNLMKQEPKKKQQPFVKYSADDESDDDVDEEEDRVFDVEEWDKNDDDDDSDSDDSDDSSDNPLKNEVDEAIEAATRLNKKKVKFQEQEKELNKYCQETSEILQAVKEKYNPSVEDSPSKKDPSFNNFKVFLTDLEDKIINACQTNNFDIFQIKNGGETSEWKKALKMDIFGKMWWLNIAYNPNQKVWMIERKPLLISVIEKAIERFGNKYNSIINAPKTPFKIPRINNNPTCIPTKCMPRSVSSPFEWQCTQNINDMLTPPQPLPTQISFSIHNLPQIISVHDQVNKQQNVDLIFHYKTLIKYIYHLLAFDYLLGLYFTFRQKVVGISDEVFYNKWFAVNSVYNLDYTKYPRLENLVSKATDMCNKVGFRKMVKIYSKQNMIQKKIFDKFY